MKIELNIKEADEVYRVITNAREEFLTLEDEAISEGDLKDANSHKESALLLERVMVKFLGSVINKE